MLSIYTAEKSRTKQHKCYIPFNQQHEAFKLAFIDHLYNNVIKCN